MLSRTVRNLLTGSVVALMGLTTGLGSTAFAAPPRDKTHTKASVRHHTKRATHKTTKHPTKKHRSNRKSATKATHRKVTHRKHGKAATHSTKATKTVRHHRVA